MIATSAVEAQVPPVEREALIAFYNSTDGDNWTNSDNWLGAVDTECTWHGVSCSDGHVVSLVMISNQLNGTLPTQLGNLTNLEMLWLYSNQLSGSIPSQIGNLTNLRDLRLGSNQLNGTLPPEMGNLDNLGVLSLYSNQLSGPIPAQFGNLSSLTVLSLNGNQLTGSIPAEIGNLANLELLYLNANQLSGAIPPQLGNLGNVTAMDLSFNQLRGSIPPQIGNLSSVTTLFLNSNRLSGNIPPELENLTNLTILRLYCNELSGAIPPELGGLTNLTSLSLNSNRLGEAIPPELGTLTNLTSLQLNSNQLRGDVPAELANLTALIASGLDLRYNALHSTDSTLIAFLNSKQIGGNWQMTQTIAPTNVTIDWVGDHTLWLKWDAVTYLVDPGGYEAFVAPSASTAWVSVGRTASKTEVEIPVTALDPGVSYDLTVATLTNPHVFNQDTVISDLSDPVMATTADLGCATPVIEVTWGTPTTLSVSTVFDSYLWNTGETSQAISVDPAQPRFYWVTVTSTGSCQESAIILADPAIFTDDFESGDASEWGS
jgi:Leucine-rich repeat (LRR) protein